MPANTYPIHVGDPILRTCRRCKSRVAVPAMCERHPRTCLTCCCSRMERECWKPMTPSPHDTVVAHMAEVDDMTWEERQAETARIRHELGFRPETSAEKAENELWRTR